MRKKILIIEDHDAFRQVVRDYLLKQDFESDIFEAPSGELGVVKALREKPDIILMDIRLPGLNGIDAATRIKQYLPKCDIIVLTMFETKAFKKVFKSDDVIYYIGKSELYEKLVPAIKRIFNRTAVARQK